MVIDEFIVSIGASTTALDKSLSGLFGKFSDLESSAKNIGVSVAAASGVAGVALVALTKKAVDYQSAIFSASKQTGVSSEALSVLAYAGRQTGNTLDDISALLNRIGVSARAAANGSKESTKAFDVFGVSVKDSSGNVKDSNKLLLEMSARMRDTGKTSITSADLIEIAGRGGARSMDLLSTNFKIAANEAKLFGVVVRDDAAASADELEDSIQKLKEPLLGIGLVIARDVIPWIIEFVKQFSEMSENTGAFKATAEVAVFAFKSIASAAIVVITGLYQVGATFVTVFESLGAAIKGDFSRAIDIMSDGFEDVKSTGSTATDQIASLWKETDKQTASAKQLSPALQSTTVDTVDATSKNEAYAIAAKETAKKNAEIEASVQDQRTAMIALYREAYPESMQTVEEWAILQAQEARNYLATQESAEAYGERMATLARDLYPEATMSAEQYGKQQLDLARIAYPEATLTAEEYGEAMAQLSKKQLQAASEAPGIAEIYKNTATSITGAFRDTFRDVFSNGVSSFKSLGKRISDLFKNVLADMAVLAITQPVIVPVVQALGSALGLGTATIGGVVGQLGGASGAAGGAGVAAQTGLGAVIGGVIKTAIPYIAAALAINAVSGGKLFGTKFKQTETGSRISTKNGQLTGYSYSTEERQKAFFGGTIVKNTTTPISQKILDEIDDGFSDLNSILKNAGKSLGLSWTAAKLYKYDNVKQEIDTSGLSPDMGQEAVESWLKMMAAQKTYNAFEGSRFDGIIKQFSMAIRKYSYGQKTAVALQLEADNILSMSTALLNLGSVLDKKPVDDYAASVAIVALSLKAQLGSQKTSLDKLLSSYDGSLSKTQDISRAMEDRYNLELQYLAQIDNVRKTMTASFQATIENFKRSKMGDEELYGYLVTKISSESAALASADDPERINEILGRINTLANEAFNVGGDKTGRADALTTVLNDTLKLGNQKLDAAQSVEKFGWEQTKTDVVDIFTRVANILEKAANEQIAVVRNFMGIMTDPLEFKRASVMNGYGNIDSEYYAEYGAAKANPLIPKEEGVIFSSTPQGSYSGVPGGISAAAAAQQPTAAAQQPTAAAKAVPYSSPLNALTETAGWRWVTDGVNKPFMIPTMDKMPSGSLMSGKGEDGTTLRVTTGASGELFATTGTGVKRLLTEIPAPAKLALGGIVDRPTMALIGEGRGPEAVIPLDRLNEFTGGNDSQRGSQSIVINLDGRQIAKIVAQHFPAILRASGVAV